MARLSVVLALVTAGCASGVDRLVGEVHLHQTPGAAHLGALFIDPPTPVERTHGDSALPTPTPVLYDEEGCHAYEVGGCAGGCAQPTEIDGGTIDITGLAQPITLRYQAAFGGYDDLVFDGQFLQGGLEVTVRGSGHGAVPAFETGLRLAEPFQPTTTLMAGTAGLTVDWSGGSPGEEVEVLLSVTPQADPGARTRVVRCEAGAEVGHLRVPDAALALLPAAPRVVQLEVTRHVLRRVALGDGLGVVLHGGYAVLEARSD